MLHQKTSTSTSRFTDLHTIDFSKVLVPDKVPCNNGKDQKHIIGYQIGESTIIPLLSRTRKHALSYGVYDKNVAYTMLFNVGDEENSDWLNSYRHVWKETESQIFDVLSTAPVKEGRFLRSKLMTWEGKIKTNFHGKKAPHDTYCTATSVLKIDSVYQQEKKCHPQVYLKECKRHPSMCTSFLLTLKMKTLLNYNLLMLF